MTREKTKSTPATTRLDAIVARDVRTAVVFRRGPSKHVRLILWDLARDTFTRGQWLAGRVYSHKWSVGDLLIWDNRCVLHRGHRWPEDQPRTMVRTTVAGDDTVLVIARSAHGGAPLARRLTRLMEKESP